MPVLIDITGSRFGELTVVKRSGVNKHNHTTWLCRCSCGREKVCSGSHLKCGKAKSCGCKWKFEPGEAAFNAVYSVYQKRAKNIGVEFFLTKEEFRRLTQQECYYCGALPSNVYSKENFNGDFVYNGVDRTDNRKGYTVKNTVACCEQCNLSKSDYTIEEFIAWIGRLTRRINEGVFVNSCNKH